MSSNYDAIVIGAGHNGLVAAAFLSKAGWRVLVIEQREDIGGAAATEELFPGYRFNAGAHHAGHFRGEIIEAFDLDIELIESPAILTALNPDGPTLTIWDDPLETVREIERFSSADAEAYVAFSHHADRMIEALDRMMLLAPPDLANLEIRRWYPWLKLALKVRGMGARGMLDFMRGLPVPVADLLDDWFENDLLKGALGSQGIIGTMQGPRASGTGFMYLYNLLGTNRKDGRGLQAVRGGTGQLIHALATVAQQNGAEIRTGVGVNRILIEGDIANGVALASGEEIHAGTIVSSTEARHTLLGLLGAAHLPVKTVRRTRNLRLRGSTARIQLALRARPHFQGISDDTARLGGHLLISPSLDYLERAYDDAKYGQLSNFPMLDIVIPSVLDPSLAPEGHHVMSVDVRYAPYKLREGDWETLRGELWEKVQGLLVEYAPDISDLIVDKKIVTPLDLEREYGLTEGSIFHGQMAFDQMLFMRPVPGLGRYQTPIGNLYLCGAGSHPGGGITGAPGYNAGREILRLQR